jgi:hypothetical protein
MGRDLVAKTTASFPGAPFAISPDQQGRLIVTEPGRNEVIRVPVASLLRSDWELEMRYVTGKPIVLQFYEAGQLIQSADVTQCSPVSNL